MCYRCVFILCCFHLFVFLKEVVSGVIVMMCKEAVQHHGIFLTMEGLVNLQLSSKSVGVFEAFYNSVKVKESVRRCLQMSSRRPEPDDPTLPPPAAAHPADQQ